LHAAGRAAGQPGKRGDVRLFQHAPAIGQAEVRVRVANVEKQEHD